MTKRLTAELLSDISNQFGDAFYLLESEQFKTNYFELMKAFKKYYSKFNIAYSYKTNYTPKLVKIIDELGGYAEVVSDMEMEIALKSGVSYAKIIWNGPVKNQIKVYELLLNGGIVNVDSIYELEDIVIFAKKNKNKKINVGLRCNYEVSDGVLSRFGFDVNGDDFDNALRTISNNKNINLKCLHSHFARRLPEFWNLRAKGIIDVYKKVTEDYHMTPEILDLGGGIYGGMPDSLREQLGVGYVTYDDYASRAGKIFSNHFQNTVESPWLFIEPGTALAGNSMRFVCKVESIKKVRGKTFVTVNGSQKNINMAGIIPPFEVISGGNPGNDVENADVVGYTCIESDIIIKNYSGCIAVGDYLVISNCGSYSLVMKPPFILPNYPVLDINGEHIEIIKKPEKFDNLFCTYVF